MKKLRFLKKYFLVAILLIVGAVAMYAQNPLGVIDDIKNVGSWGDAIGLYEMLLGALTLVITQIGKLIPGINKLNGLYLSILVVVLIVVIGIVKFGAGSVGSAPVIWMIATFIYDKFLKKDKPQEREFPIETSEGI